MILADDGRLDLAEFPVDIQDAVAAGLDLEQAVGRAERAHIAMVLRLCEGNREKAAEELGISVATLYRHMEKPDWQCRFKWKPNSMAFWDNRCVLHNAMWDYFPQRRFGYRVTVCGDKPK